MSKKQWGHGFYKGYETAVNILKPSYEDIGKYIDKYEAHCYYFYSLDCFWDHLRSIKETIMINNWFEQDSSSKADEERINYIFSHAKKIAEYYTNTIENDDFWKIFWIPCEVYFEYGFSVKGDKGYGFVCSPVRLPHLEDISRWKRVITLSYSSLLLPA
jgi:hypothetical protein